MAEELTTLEEPTLAAVAEFFRGMKDATGQPAWTVAPETVDAQGRLSSRPDLQLQALTLSKTESGVFREARGACQRGICVFAQRQLSTRVV